MGENKPETNYGRLAYRYFGRIVEKYLSSGFKDLQIQLSKANIRLTAAEYLSLAIATSTLVFVFEMPLLALIMTVVFGDALVGFIFGLFGGIFTTIGIYFLYNIYPTIIVDERKKKIDDSLPFAVLYLATISGSGTPIVAMFKTIAKFKEYGEISKECSRIVEEVELMGSNITDALETAAKRTPSEKFKEILWGLKSTITVGGDLKAYLHEKAQSSMNDYRRRLTQFTQQLSMFIEMYITVVVVGSIFFMILTTIMGGIGGATGFITIMQVAMVLIGLPFASFAFIVLIKGMAPSSD